MHKKGNMLQRPNQTRHLLPQLQMLICLCMLVVNADISVPASCLSCWGVLWFFKRPQVCLLEKHRNWQHYIWCLITNTWENRVEIVSSVIIKILTLANIGWSRFNLQFCMFSESVFVCIRCQFSVIARQFCSIFLHLCSVFFVLLLFDYSVFNFHLLSVIFCPDTGIVFFLLNMFRLFKYYIHTAYIRHSRNIHTALCYS
jgi:hypothetical protein